MRKSEFGARGVVRSIVALGALAAGATCNVDDRDPVEPAITAKLPPIAVSEPGAWALFDSSMASAFRPGVHPVRVTLERAEPIAALRVRGPAPYRISMRGLGGVDLGFERVDASQLSAGWHTFASSAPVSADAVLLELEPVGVGGAVPELELWTTSAPATPEPGTSLATALAPGDVSFASSAQRTELSPGSCATFDVAIDREPTGWRHAYLAYDAQGVFRPCSLRRAINSRAAVGGAWLASDAENHSLVEEIDPRALQQGANAIRLCAPDAAAARAAISKLRIIGSPDRGTALAARATIGESARDATALIDGDVSTTAAIGAGEPVAIGFDRLVAPFALVGVGDDTPTVECLDRTAKATPVRAHRQGAIIQLTLAGCGKTLDQHDHEAVI